MGPTSASTPTSSAPTSSDAGLVRKDQLVRSAARTGGRDYRFSLPGLDSATPVLAGEFESLQLRPGLALQRTRVRDLHDMQTSLTLKPALRIDLLVSGETEFSLGSARLRLGPQRDGRGRLHNLGAVVATTEPDTFCRHWRAGRAETKVALTLLPEWLDGGAFAESHALDALRAFRERHLSQAVWQPSPRALALAHQIAQPPPFTTPFRHLYLEARAIELAAEALAGSVPADAAPPPRALPLREQRRLRELLAWMDARPAATLTLDEIAREAAMSPSTLQRAFKAFSGRPLFEHLRERRLDAARQALERDGASVALAAEIAGYARAHNFATAFKRRFGCTPRQMQPRGLLR